MTNEWKTLYDAAMAVVCYKELPGGMTLGQVAAAVQGKSGKIYTGVCIDTACSLGMCAERNAISTMFTRGEYEFTRVVAVYQDGAVLPPCGACREFMLQTGMEDAQILISEKEAVRLADLMPARWR